MLSTTACVNGAELDTPEPARFSADGDASSSQEVFSIAVAQIGMKVEPGGGTAVVRGIDDACI